MDGFNPNPKFFEREDMAGHRLLGQCADTMSYSMF